MARSYFKVTDYDEQAAADKSADLPYHPKISREVFFFFWDNSALQSAAAYLKASKTKEEWGTRARISVWRRPCISVSAPVVGEDLDESVSKVFS